MATISWGGKISGNDHKTHWAFDVAGEDKIMRADPVRTFPHVDSTPEWVQPRKCDYGLSARCMDGKTIINRSQKPVQQSM